MSHGCQIGQSDSNDLGHFLKELNTGKVIGKLSSEGGDPTFEASSLSSELM
jgi:hypothetical protein